MKPLTVKQARLVVVRMLKSEYPGWTVDDLLVRPTRAIYFCERVRRIHPNAADSFDDEVILRLLINTRKAGLSVKGKERAK